jgi:predicted DNA-binding helix-hairpin-helix protein
LKVMPGSDYDQVKRSMQLADRISVNLEAPNPFRLQKLAPLKDFWQQLWQPLTWVEQIRRSQPPHLGWKNHWPSSSTQFVVGGSRESDLELLQTTESLKNELHVQRVYYSAFTAHMNTPLENQPATSLKRQERLYQAFYLLRDYFYKVSELQFDSFGNLSLQKDPKMMWAENHLIQQPIEINKASPAELLRIPGIGPLGVKKIIESRQFHTIDDISDLYKLGIRARKAQAYILLNGHQPAAQISLF